jgi:3-phenylpropionate/trans-cinnamate dioxygenase ferredoxin reductase subunit
MRKRILIIGGGQAGGRLAQLLSQDSESLDVTIFCREQHAPYERPPLSKAVILGSSTIANCLIWRSGSRAWDAIQAEIGVSVTAINRKTKTVTVDTGTDVAYDKLIIATGSSIRRFDTPGSDLNGVFSLRTYDDAIAIAESLKKTRRLLVVGGGFIGLEVAAAARAIGVETHVIEASDRILSRIVPKPVAERLLERHRAAGVTFDFQSMVQRFVSDGRKGLKAAVLSTGERVDCNMALVGVGVSPNVELASAAGLDVDVGVCTDDSLITSDPDILACGDVASFWHPLFDRQVRIEAWQNAEDHAGIAAAVLRGSPAPKPAVPGFWSDQYEFSMQLMGLPYLGVFISERWISNTSLVLLHLDAQGRVLGATGFGTAEEIGREMRRVRSLINQKTVIEMENFS